MPDPTPHPVVVSPPASVVSASPEHGGQLQASSELSRYLDRNYWEQRVTRDASAPTAPSQTPAPASLASNDTEDFTKPSQSKAQDDDAEDKEIDEFVETLKSQVEIFVNRMKSDSSRGRSIANDTAVQTLFMNITAMHSKLLRYIQQQDDKRVYLESLQDKVSQIRDSRAALDTLRAEHAARVAAAAEAAERARQLQMAAKLHAMRKKKHEYLQYQRQLALQRVQEQEREMQMRQEQQKHQYMMSANSGYFMPNMPMPQFQQGYNNQPMYGNPQFHPQMMQTTTEANLPMPGQPQSQATMHMGVNPMSTAAQSLPQLTNTYAAMSTTTPNPGLQSSINQTNLRPGMGAQVPMHPMMMQMHQMRLPGQPGVHQMTPQGLTNGQTNAQNGQLQKNVPNQQVPNSMMPPMTTGQQNIGQMYTNPTSIQMQNMRMPLMANQGPMPGYMNPQNNNIQQPGIQNPQSQIPGQQMPGPSQSMMQPGQNQGMSNHIPNIGQNTPQGAQVTQSQAQPTQQPQAPQMSHGQPMSIQGQQMMPAMQMQNIPNQAPNVNHGQPMPYQHMSQHMPPQQMNMPNQPPVQQMQMKMQHPNSQQPNVQNLQQPAVQHPNMQQPNMQQPNMQQPNMQQPNMQQPNMQQSNMQQPNMQQPNMQQSNMQQPNMQQPNIQQPNMQQPNIQQPNLPQPNMQQPNFGNQNQSQPAQTPNKSEHNNNTAELISFD